MTDLSQTYQPARIALTDTSTLQTLFTRATQWISRPAKADSIEKLVHRSKVEETHRNAVNNLLLR